MTQKAKKRIYAVVAAEGTPLKTYVYRADAVRELPLHEEGCRIEAYELVERKLSKARP